MTRWQHPLTVLLEISPAIPSSTETFSAYNKPLGTFEYYPGTLTNELILSPPPLGIKINKEREGSLLIDHSNHPL
jgi:hypothetical protein